MIKINDKEAIVIGEIYRALKQDNTCVGIFQGGAAQDLEPEEQELLAKILEEYIEIKEGI